MTLAELIRAIESKKRLQKDNMREKATFDYTLAELIGRSVARVYNSANTMPDIETVYPTLFDSQQIEETKQEKQDKLSAVRFKQFADSFNRRFKQGGGKSN